MELKILDSIDVVVLDIEGTTTPIDFVHKTLFKYARLNMRDFLNKNKNSGIIKKALNEIMRTFKDNENSISNELVGSTGHGFSIENAAAMLNHLIDIDSKAPQLKLIEGMIWEEGYRNGRLKGEVYSDVPVFMKKWAYLGKDICIYSSGSILAQKLIFSTTKYGDLTSYITGYFDTGTGRKTDPESYGKIAASLKKDPGRILFLSDSQAEINAAASKGFRAIMVQRDGNPDMNANPGIVSSFSEIA